MDALIYTALSGAERTLHAQQVHANNLANMETPGFRASMELASSQAVPGYGFDTRHMGRLQADTISTKQGVIKETGRELDLAVTGDGFLAVEFDGGEAYTRSGAMMLDGDGALTINGHPVLGEGGPIVLPPYSKLEFGTDGTVSVLPEGELEMQVIDKLKLVKAEAANLTRNEAGLIVARDGAPLEADDTVIVRGGHLEGSNVSAVEEMVATMSLNRAFEVQMKLYASADKMAEAGNRLVGS